MLTNKKYSGMRPLVVVASLIVAVTLLPFAGCKTDVDPVASPAKYTVTFDSKGGSDVASQTVESGKTAAKPEDPTKADSDFAGWYSDEELATAYDFDTPVAKDITLYAKWNPKESGGNTPGAGEGGTKTYTVTFDSKGGSAVAGQTVESGKTATTPAEPELEGSWFLGWYADSGLTTEFDFSAPVTADTTLYAKWSYKLHTKPTKLSGSEWTYVEFGDWPQTVKAGDVTVDDTKSKTMGGLTYCLGSDGNHYVEAEENAYGSGTEYKYSNEEQAGQGGTTTKWFKVEPIVWRVLTDSYNGKALLLAERILTGGVAYCEELAQRTIGSQTVYTNNYKYSTVRAWLNGSYEDGDDQAKTYNGTGFLQTAFTTSAQALIAETTVDNSRKSTNPAYNPGAENQYACDNTTDKVFLLSVREATTSDYGFDEFGGGGAGSTRIRAATDYAKATGAYQDSSAGYGGLWWLRSPFWIQDSNAYIVSHDGEASNGNLVNGNLVNGTDWGVVPALCVELQ